MAAILWSTGGLFVKLLPQDAFTILFYRSLYTSIFFLIFLNKKVFNFNKISFLTGLCYVPLMVCFILSTKMTTAANAIFAQSTGVAYVLLLEPIFLKSKLKKIDILTVTLCFAGLLLLLFNDFNASSINSGIYIAMGTGIASAAIMLLQKMNQAENVASGIFLGNLLVVLVTSFAFFKNPLPSLNENLILMFLGFIQLGLGFVLFMWGQRVLAAVDSALISLLEPIFNPIWVAIGYGEIPNTITALGGIIIIFSIVGRLLYLHYDVKNKV
jgi:drug/metabolite transporter (DMT)-like permease